jgi:hypothetical protein
VAVLRRLVPHLRPGGVAAFYEADFTVPRVTYPPAPLSDRMAHVVLAAIAAAGVHLDAGMRLQQIFLDSGLAAPRTEVYASLGGGRDYIEEIAARQADTVRSLLPVMVARGIATEQEVEIETLAVRLREVLLQRGSVVRSTLFVGAWAQPS